MAGIVNEIGGIEVSKLAKKFGTPTFVYQKEIIEARINDLKPFKTVRYAQKACSNLAILKLTRKNGIFVDAVSAGEILRAVTVGYKTGKESFEIVYTADIFDNDAIKLIKKYNIPVNVGSPDMITQLGKFAPGSRVILRLNPGFGHGHSKKVNTGGNLSKHGIWHEDLAKCMDLGVKAGVYICGLHMHIGSGSDFEHLSQVVGKMEEMAGQLGPQLEIISAGGGLPIPYRKTEARIDISKYFQMWNEAKKRIEVKVGHAVELEVEPGRYLIAESCTLLTQIRSIKNTGGTDFYVVDAGFDNLIRPAMYGAYHDISIASKSNKEKEVVVAGPLCESCDVFTQEEGGFVTKRLLPHAKVGDYLLIHDTGAYGSAMSSNYNTRRLAAEVLIADGEPHLIRKRQPLEKVFQYDRIPAFLE